MASMSSVLSNMQSGLSANGRSSGQNSNALNIESGLQRATNQNAAYLQEAKSLYEPYASSGATSLNEYMKLLTGGVSDLQNNDQNFNDMLNLSQKSVMANKAVGGLLRSTGTASALNDSTLKFQNDYYGNRLNQMLQGVGVGQWGVAGQADMSEKLGANQMGLAEALSQIQIERESMASNERSANNLASTQKEVAQTTGGLFGRGGFLGLGI